MYNVSKAAVGEMLVKEGLDHLLARNVQAMFIPWKRRKLAHDQDYAIVCLRLYVRSLGFGAPLTNPELDAKAEAGTLTDKEAGTRRSLADLRSRLAKFKAEMDRHGAVVTYDYETGFDFVPAEPGDRHYVRWPADVPDHRDEALAGARLRARV